MSEKKQSQFATLAPTVDKFPLLMVIFGWFLVMVNTTFGILFLINPAGVILGLGSTSAILQATIMLGARNLGSGFILGFALLFKNTRVLQAVWVFAIIREVGDLVAALAGGGGFSGAIVVIVILVIEIIAFIYTGAIASGHIAKYKKA
ncbi:MAG: hypothetical protein AABZ00_16250 [Chloroflexota bacterium]